MPSEQGSNMANAETELTVAEAYEIADRFAQASARILDFRVNTGNLSGDQADALEKAEDQLDAMVVLFRSHGIQLIGAKAEAAAQNIKAAIDAAKSTLVAVRQIRKVLKVAAALVDLAVAIVSKNVQGGVAAAKTVADASKDDKGGKDGTKGGKDGNGG
jgi:ribulose-5-phosphate 4-epimerase/fuculose-1-phosphate aldolase